MGEGKKKRKVSTSTFVIICLSNLNYQIERRGGKKKRKNDLSIVYRLFSFVIKCKRAPRILKSTIIIAAVQFPGQAREKKKKKVFNEPSRKIMVFNPRSIQVAWEVHFVVLLIFA